MAGEFSGKNYQNIDGFIGAIVNSGKATLQELKTVYTLEDAMNIWEAIMIPRYNDFAAQQKAQREKQK